MYYFHYLAVLSALQVNQPDCIYFHYQYEPQGLWWEKIKRLVTPIQRTALDKIGDKTLHHYAHKADVMRLQLLIEHGGIYLDIDTLCLKPWHVFLDNEFVIGEELQYKNAVQGLCNAVLFSQPQSIFLRAWLEEYPAHFKEDGWSESACLLPRLLSQQRALEKNITILPTETLHAPTGSDLFKRGDVPDALKIAHWWGHTKIGDALAKQSSPDFVLRNPHMLFSKMVHKVFGENIPRG